MPEKICEPAAERVPADEPIDLLVGAEAIGRPFGWAGHQVYRLAREGLPTFRIGGRLAATRQGLQAWIHEREAAARAEREAKRPDA